MVMRVIGGRSRGFHLKTRKGLETRPTADLVRESLFNILARRVVGSRFLDIFAGFGGVGIEALSRGACFCVFIENNRQCVKIISENLTLTNFTESALVVPKSADSALRELAEKAERFELVFLDPPYFSPALPAALRFSLPLLVPDGLVVVEHHRLDTDWLDPVWTVIREKKYGDTILTFLVAAVH
jgi:16S rRNA (guanine966-N2)-methyltransferase